MFELLFVVIKLLAAFGLGKMYFDELKKGNAEPGVKLGFAMLVLLISIYF